MQIFKKSFDLTRDDSKSNLKIPFNLDQDYTGLVIRFKYDPKLVDDETSLAVIQKALEDYLPKDQGGVTEEEARDYLPARNLITASLSYEGTYLGAHHNQAPEQEISLCKTGSSRGFLRASIDKGDWEVQFNLHAIYCPVRLEVEIRALQERAYLPIELHTHTHHSDGSFTPKGLFESAEAFGYSGLVLTDHNSFSAYEEAEEQGLTERFPALKGMEWTTYYGHMLVMGLEEVVDWRQATPENIDEKIRAVKETGAVVGIAHPFVLGSPICTGCHWKFKVQDWSQVDFIEVWNRENPETKFWNLQAYELWLDKLNQGHRIFATSGRDWHGQEDPAVHTPVSYLGFRGEVTSVAIKEALERGDLYCTLGPRFDYQMIQKGRAFFMGDHLESGSEVDLKIKIEKTDIFHLKNFDQEPERILLYNNDQLICDQALSSDEFKYQGNFEKGFVRFELRGQFDGRESLLAFSNPFYINE